MSDSMRRRDLLRIIGFVEDDLRSCLAKLTEARAQLAALPIEDAEAARCDLCGLVLPGSYRLAEHCYHAHAGPEPEHWRAIEERSLEPTAAEVSADV